MCEPPKTCPDQGLPRMPTREPPRKCPDKSPPRNVQTRALQEMCRQEPPGPRSVAESHHSHGHWVSEAAHEDPRLPQELAHEDGEVRRVRLVVAHEEDGPVVRGHAAESLHHPPVLECGEEHGA